jgi:hypothetical protein
MAWYCVCSAGGTGQVQEREDDPTPEEAIYWSGPYTTEEEAILNCYGIECPQGWWCLCSRIITEGKSVTQFYNLPPENVCYTTYLGPYNTKGQAATACIDPETEEPIKCETQVIVPAYDICKPPITYSSAITLECSLACTDLGFPMKSGFMNVQFGSEPCGLYDTAESIWFPPTRFQNIGLGCTQDEDPPDGYWIGYNITNVGAPRCDDITHGTIPGYGLTLRNQVSITVLDANSLYCELSMQRLVPGSEFDPPLAENQWVTCQAASGVAYRLLAPDVDINTRYLSWLFTTDRIPFSMEGQCSTDVKSIVMTVSLTPWLFACGKDQVGEHGEGCGLPFGKYTHGCATVSMRPTDIGNYDPRFQGPSWGALGYNASNCGTVSGPPCGCGVGRLPEVINPTPSDPTTNLLEIGCPGEVDDAYQNYQLNFAGGYEVLIKTIDRGSFCVAVRLRDIPGRPWIIAGTDDSTYDEVVTDTHWYARITVPSIAGKPEINLYAFRFPNPVINDCIHDLDPLPPVWPPPPGDGNVLDSGPVGDPPERSLVRYSDDRFSYILWDQTVSPVLAVPPITTQVPSFPQTVRTVSNETKAKMAEIQKRFEKRCIYLGAEKKNTGCCGSSNLYHCGKYTECRRFGKSRNGEPVCSSCEDYKEMTDAI